MTTKKLLTGLISGAMLLSLSGCGLFTNDSNRQPAELADLKPATAAVETAWKASVGDSVYNFLMPALTGNGIYAAGGKHLYRLDAKSGAKIWEASTKDEVSSGVGSDGYYAAVGTVKGDVVAFSADGKELWRRTMPSEVDMPPLVGHNLVIVHTSDTRVTAYNAQTGEKAWHYQGQVPILSLRAPREMMFFADGLLVGEANGKMVGLTLEGKTAFEASISQPSGITEVERLNDVVGAPLVTSGMLCAASYQGRLTCMNAQNGATRWTVKVDAVTGPTSDGRAIYVVDAKSVIHAYEVASGNELWKNDSMTYRGNTAPVSVGNYLATGDLDGYVHLLNPENGKEVGRGRLSGAMRVAPQAFGDGAVMQTDKGTVAFVRASAR